MVLDDIDRIDDVRGPTTAGDESGPLVVHAIPDLARVLIAVVVRSQ
jgi:hypothetical protein